MASVLFIVYSKNSLIKSNILFQRPEMNICSYRVPQKYRPKVYGSEGHKNGANQILILWGKGGERVSDPRVKQHFF